MDSDIDDLNKITEKSTIEVHRNSEHGLLESIYENALCYELNENDGIYENRWIY